MNYGDTFLIRQKGRLFDSHLWIVISDPMADPVNVVIVNLTTFAEGKDSTCRLEVGEHPYISHDSCIQYAGAKVISAAFHAELVAASGIIPKQPASDDLLDKILAGVGAAIDHMPMKVVSILLAQDLIRE